MSKVMRSDSAWAFELRLECAKEVERWAYEVSERIRTTVHQTNPEFERAVLKGMRKFAKKLRIRQPIAKIGGIMCLVVDNRKVDRVIIHFPSLNYITQKDTASGKWSGMYTDGQFGAVHNNDDETDSKSEWAWLGKIFLQPPEN